MVWKWEWVESRWSAVGWDRLGVWRVRGHVGVRERRSRGRRKNWHDLRKVAEPRVEGAVQKGLRVDDHLGSVFGDIFVVERIRIPVEPRADGIRDQYPRIDLRRGNVPRLAPSLLCCSCEVATQTNDALARKDTKHRPLVLGELCVELSANVPLPMGFQVNILLTGRRWTGKRVEVVSKERLDARQAQVSQTRAAVEKRNYALEPQD